MKPMNSTLTIKGKINTVRWDKELSSIVPAQYESTVELNIMDAMDSNSLMISLGSYEYTIEQLESLVDQAKRLLKAQAVFAEGIETKVESNLKTFKVGFENGSKYHVVFVDAMNEDDALAKFKTLYIDHTDITELREATAEDFG